VPIREPIEECTNYSVQTVSRSANMIARKRADRAVGAGSHSQIWHSNGVPRFALECPLGPEPGLVRR
jgi:hypothetical protein